MIYLDYAASTPLCEEAYEAMQESLPLFANPSSTHSAGMAAKRVLEQSRKVIAECVSASPEQVIFTSGGTESNNMILQGFMHSAKDATLILSSMEHPSVRNIAENYSESEKHVFFLPVSESGAVSVSALKEVTTTPNTLVSVMTANNETGVLQPISEIARYCQKQHILFHSDAVQAIGHIPFSFEHSGVDFLSASAHKFGGPKGIGFLLVRNPENVRPLLFGGGQEHGLRSGTESILLISGMAAALQASIKNLKKNTIQIQKCKALMEEGLRSLTIRVLYSDSERLPGTTAAIVPQLSAETLQNRLSLFDTCISTGSACSSLSQGMDPALKSFGLSNDEIRHFIRISIGSQTTEKEIRTFINQIKQQITL